MATKYVEKYASTAALLANAPDRTPAAGVGSVSDVLYHNVSGAAVALVDASAAQTLTNKTLTAPTITAPVITGQVADTEQTIVTRVLVAADSGKTLFLNAAVEFVTTLPAPAAGLNFTFIVTAAPAGASYTVITNASANIIKGQQYPASGAAGDTGTADDTISFVDGQAVAGDKVIVISDGTSWFAYAYSAVAAGVTFTQAS